MFALLLALPILLLPAAAAAAPIAFGDVVVLTGSSVVSLSAANGYAANPPVPITVTDPRALDVAADGRVYVLDQGDGFPTEPDTIVELSPDGTQRPFTPTGTRPWGPSGEMIDVFLVEPRDMAMGRDGRLWVADQGFHVQNPALGFDGSVIFVDPATGAIASDVGPGTSPRLIDIGPFAGAVLLPSPANLVVLWIDSGPEPDPFGFRGCDGCDGLMLLGSPSVLRDGRIVVNGREIGPASGLFGARDVSDVSA
ncbi:MAG: hypothetical protein L0206_25290, partial [Actinobacteria bacterium]|nr:hypothetical protein [Actinomycetota bacterium]